jgi:hypothetical protein
MVLNDKTHAKRMLKRIGTGSCAGKCRSIWLREIRYALKSKTNSLNLNAKEKKEFKTKLEALKGGKLATKKYTKRTSPPFPANDFCGKKKKGNDGKMYLSKPNKNGICRWIKCD